MITTFKIGDVIVHQIFELSRLPVEPNWLLANATAEGIAAEFHWQGERFIEPGTGKLIVSMHSYLIRAGGLNILVDTCFGHERNRGPASPYHMLKTDYLNELRLTGLTEADIDYVFCTHLHVDHVGWNTRLENGRWVPTFPNAKYLFNRLDYEERLEEDREGRARVANQLAFKECVVPIVEAGRATFLDPGTRFVEELVRELRLVELPGHSAGHSGLEIISNGQRALMTGDAIHHPVQLVNPHWYCTADTDHHQSTATRQQVIEEMTDTSDILLTAHFPAPTPGRIVSRNGVIRFESLPW